MSCVIREIDESAFDPEVLERQLGLALIKEHDGDASALLVMVLDFLKRKTNFFKHADSKQRVVDAYAAVLGEAQPAAAAPATAAAAPAAATGAAASQAGAGALSAAVADKPEGVSAAEVRAGAHRMRAVGVGLRRKGRFGLVHARWPGP